MRIALHTRVRGMLAGLATSDINVAWQEQICAMRDELDLRDRRDTVNRTRGHRGLGVDQADLLMAVDGYLTIADLTPQALHRQP